MLCTRADVEVRLHEEIDAGDEAAVDLLIAAAQGHIEREAGRPLEEAAYTETFDGDRRTLVLTHWPVTAIDSVTEEGVALDVGVDVAFYSDGRLRRLLGGFPTFWQTNRPQAIEVTYSGGYDPVPADLVDLCATMTARAWVAGVESAARRGEAEGGIKRVRLEDREWEYDSSQFDMAAAFGAIQLTEDETDWVREAYGTPVVS